MHFVLQTPSLQHIAGVKIVAHFWSQRDIFTRITQSSNGLPGYILTQDKEEWVENVVDKVRSKVSLLPIPGLCKKPLLNIIELLGKEVIEWSDYLNLETIKFPALDVVLPHQLYWTMHGTINHKKTAQLLVNDERLDVGSRYELACINCLEDGARELFQRMGKEQRRENEFYSMGSTRATHYGDLIIFFTCTLRGKVRHLNNHFKGMLSPGESINKRLFVDTLLWGNRATCEYLFTKLQPGEKEQFFVEGQEDVSSRLTPSPTCNVLYYLSLMNEEQQKRLFRESRPTRFVLKYLLRWPLQSLFVEAAERGWQFMENFRCDEVLNVIIYRISRGYKEYDYLRLFWECWRLSSAEMKRYFLEDISNLDNLFQTKRRELIQLILNEAPLFQLIIFHKICRVLMDDSAIISDAALMEYKETAALNSSNDPQNEEKRLRSECLNRLVDTVMESRKKCRLCGFVYLFNE